MYTRQLRRTLDPRRKTQGTLPRLLVSPTTSTQILGGKVFGIFLTGAAQMLILIGASSLLFQLKWGDPIGVVLLVLAAVFGATGWGMFITALARTSAQVANIGMSITLISASSVDFVNLDQMPPAIQAFSKITPNAWALDGFTHSRSRRDINGSFHADTCSAFNGHDLIFSFCCVIRQKKSGAKMKKIFAIAWKDAIVRFASSSELIFFIILPLIFTFLLAGGTPSNDDDNRVSRCCRSGQDHRLTEYHYRIKQFNSSET
ncbi:MAG: ABC transporter permease [Anaerolineales bacterium]|uniref:ABC transporter permease n=1 Tax=Candidatus Villigracilis proximus TaxID=3140683 RepID=UPI0031354F16|nr:ABC transporter permease [Anaerolineales bacterium]